MLCGGGKEGGGGNKEGGVGWRGGLCYQQLSWITITWGEAVPLRGPLGAYAGSHGPGLLFF